MFMIILSSKQKRLTVYTGKPLLIFFPITEQTHTSIAHRCLYAGMMMMMESNLNSCHFLLYFSV